MDLRDVLQSALITWSGSEFHSAIALLETVLFRKFVFGFGSFNSCTVSDVMVFMKIQLNGNPQWNFLLFSFLHFTFLFVSFPLSFCFQT